MSEFCGRHVHMLEYMYVRVNEIDIFIFVSENACVV